MRDRELKQEEIDLAPEWATHYSVDKHGDILFESDDYYQWLEDKVLRVVMPQPDSGISDEAKPIPRQKIDITEYEFSDGIKVVSANETSICVSIKGSAWAPFYEDDIDIFKAHFVALRGKDE